MKLDKNKGKLVFYTLILCIKALSFQDESALTKRKIYTRIGTVNRKRQERSEKHG